jgi:hypothetical protein
MHSRECSTYASLFGHLNFRIGKHPAAAGTPTHAARLGSSVLLHTIVQDTALL